MIIAIFILSLVTLFWLMLLTMEFVRVSDLYEQMVKVLAADRDALKADNATLKAALFPQLSRLAGVPTTRQSQASPQSPTAPTPAFFPSRKPWRIQFKELMRKHNTQQIGQDRLAAALQEKKP